MKGQVPGTAADGTTAGLESPVPGTGEEEPGSIGPEPDREQTAGGETGEDESREEDEGETQIVNPDRKWYVVHTYSGYENKVRANLEKRVQSMEMQDKIFKILVPMEEEIEFKDGKRRTTKKKVFPGYVLVEMIMGDDSWYVVRNTPGVTGFVGSGSKPIPLLDEEIELVMRRLGADEPRRKIDFAVGENVRIGAGPFSNFIGRVDEINYERGKVRVRVSMFGRETPVELEFGQVARL
ncbi:MAG: transcription termination/antitermination protein NusG [Firmicutes bacterium]|nr:transcription termination/antitermination protein NusG [Bacillota bacterium]